MKIVFRDVVEADKPFIYASWLKGLRHGNSWFNEIDQDAYYGVYHRVLERLLLTSAVKVACLEEDKDVILGYAVYSGPTLHWVFIKKAWRKLGIARKLLPLDITTCTHLTKVGKTLKPADWKFIPFFI